MRLPFPFLSSFFLIVRKQERKVKRCKSKYFVVRKRSCPELAVRFAGVQRMLARIAFLFLHGGRLWFSASGSHWHLLLSAEMGKEKGPPKKSFILCSIHTVSYFSFSLFAFLASRSSSFRIGACDINIHMVSDIKAVNHFLE